jgi:hypothetical protein
MVNGLVAGGGALARRMSMAKAAIAFILSTADSPQSAAQDIVVQKADLKSLSSQVRFCRPRSMRCKARPSVRVLFSALVDVRPRSQEPAVPTTTAGTIELVAARSTRRAQRELESLARTFAPPRSAQFPSGRFFRRRTPVSHFREAKFRL